ncbi:MAG: DOMON-like domain-containing protein [Cyanobacteria bacterium J06632_22]
MTIREFSLKPFKSCDATVGVDVTGRISRHNDRLMLTYEVLGHLGALVVPTRAAVPRRQDDLWQATCFECFLRPVSQSQYWEVNLSPSYCWNVYRFQAYRSGGQPETAVQALPFEVLSTSTALQTVWGFDLSVLGLAQQELAIAIATVLQVQDGPLTYWALSHPGPEPDFHHRDSFVMTL